LVSNLTLGTPDSYYLYTYNEDNNNVNFALGTGAIKPFESFVTVSGVEGTLRSSLGTGAITSLKNMTATNDPVIETQYYNLQGVKILQPLNNAIYIVKKIHASNKVEITKSLNKK
jgi:hypothetical protein